MNWTRVIPYDEIDAGHTPIVSSNTPQIINQDRKFSGVTIQADPTNKGTIFIGSRVNQFLKLLPGDSIALNIDNLNKLYIRGQSGDQINWLGVK
jgi:hypothetical protein